MQNSHGAFDVTGIFICHVRKRRDASGRCSDAMIRVKFLRPPVRKYETENYYETDPEQIRQSPDAGKPKGGKTVAKKEK